MFLKDLWSVFHPAAELFGNVRDDSPFAPHCPINLPLSCQNHSTVPDSCCFEYPGGIFLQTQFWDYDPSAPDLDKGQLEKELGPLDSFTIHGLWPDDCAGGYEQFCDSSSTIRDVSTLLSSDQFNNDEHGLEYSGKELLELLGRYWKGIRGNDEPLWIHEFNKHGTCVKTIKPSCYARWEDSKTEVKTVDFHKQAVYDYFRIAYNLYKKLNTSDILAAKGIVPSVDKVYTRKEIEEALSEGFHGLQVHLACDRNQAINEVWYYHVLKGSLLNEQFVPMPALGGSHSNCPETGVKFLPKGYHIPSKRPLLSGYVKLSGESGFLVKNGHWMTRGTPATFSLLDNPFGDYYLRSRNGLCGFNNDGALQCNKGSQGAAQFGYDEANGGYLSFGGSSQWNADSRPQGMRQAPIYHGESEGISFKLKFEKRRQY